MNYKLKQSEENKKGNSIKSSFERLTPFFVDEKRNLIITIITVIVSSATNLIAPIIIGFTIDNYIKTKDYQGILINAGILLWMYIIESLSRYIQTKTMGGVGRRFLFNIRNTIFNKLQELPIEFFNQNKSGDLISRINNDTDKINWFIWQALMQFIWNFFLIIWTGIFILFLNFKLALATLLPALIILWITQILFPWVKRKNFESLQTLWEMSAEIQESLSNFKVIIAFNRLDYFRKKFEDTNEENYKISIRAGIASNIFTPIYWFASNLASLISLCYGLYLISIWDFSLGLLISFQFYVNNFYSPLRQMATVWSSLQLALASFERIGEVISLESNLVIIESQEKIKTTAILDFKNVSFHYVEGENILKNISFSLEKWKTYALVGPTGGGKTTTASLMARLYDPTEGTIFLDGKDIRSYSHSDRVKKIGFILQEPFLFSWTLKENILYGNEEYGNYSNEQITEVLKKSGLFDLLNRFEWWLENPIVTSGESISLWQKQLIAFVRAFLRNPEVLILDEATANIDTVTEQILEEILEKLPKETTRLIIAHRLNTIKNADEIFFVNAGVLTVTGSMENALEMLLHGKRES
jgi:ATP-binding cassette, subfamily B, bacterial